MLVACDEVVLVLAHAHDVADILPHEEQFALVLLVELEPAL